MKSARVSLRAEPQERLATDYIKDMVKRYDFFDSYWNVFGSFENEFVDNGGGTVTDRATGLMWQKSGSSRSKTWSKANLYIDTLNKNQFAGYSDWRLPTIDELVSLIEKSDTDKLHIHSMFDRKQKHCWSKDSSDKPLHPEITQQRWTVNFVRGRYVLASYCFLANCSSPYNHYDVAKFNYVRAVRSVK